MVDIRIVMPFKESGHSHRTCLESALSAAETKCNERGIRLTRLRRRVLELVWSSHEPVKAYDILDMIRGDDFSSAPPTVYRALDFLQAEGMVHKIESLNAYVGCAQPDNKHISQFLICHSCGSVAEMEDAEVRNLLAETAKQLGFHVDYEIIEIKGLCSACFGNKS
jgi:Fur family transcriptional regulator, zinc uptake regulator